MKALNWRSTAVWTGLSLLFLLLALLFGPARALAGGVGQGVGLVLYEVTEDMYLLDKDGKPTGSLANAVARAAVAQLSGYAKLGTPLCPWEVLVVAPGAKGCMVNASGGDNLSLLPPDAGKGSISGTFAVVVQGDNKADAPEFVVMTGSFGGSADLSLPFAGVAPIGYIPAGQGVVDQTGQTFTFTGKFRLPYALDPHGKQAKPRRHQPAYYLADDDQSPVAVEGSERSLGWPTVRLEIKF
jgi:hypothetical protein